MNGGTIQLESMKLGYLSPRSQSTDDESFEALRKSISIEGAITELEHDTQRFNKLLASSEVSEIFPVLTGMDLLSKLDDGRVIGAFLNIVPGHTLPVNFNRLHQKLPLSVFQKSENLQYVLSVANSMGLRTRTIDATDFLEAASDASNGTLEVPVLVLSFLHQLGVFYTRSTIQSLGKIENAGFSSLNGFDDDLELVWRRFMNELLRKAGSGDRMPISGSFGEVLADSHLYFQVLNYLSGRTEAHYQSQDKHENAESLVEYATEIGIHVYVDAKDLANGSDSAHSRFIGEIAEFSLLQIKEAADKQRAPAYYNPDFDAIDLPLLTIEDADVESASCCACLRNCFAF